MDEITKTFGIVNEPMQQCIANTNFQSVEYSIARGSYAAPQSWYTCETNVVILRSRSVSPLMFGALLLFAALCDRYTTFAMS